MSLQCFLSLDPLQVSYGEPVPDLCINDHNICPLSKGFGIQHIPAATECSYLMISLECLTG